MKKFENENELAKEYAKTYNASYNGDTEKLFSVEDVKDVCFESIPAISFNLLYDKNEQPGTIVMVRGFGYTRE